MRPDLRICIQSDHGPGQNKIQKRRTETLIAIRDAQYRGSPAEARGAGTLTIQLHADSALNAMADAGLKPADIDGIATAGETPVTVAHYLGLTPKWVDGTAVGSPRDGP